MVALGDFSVLDVKSLRTEDWIIFVLCTFLLLILMLNLLIAVISDTFARVTQNQVEYSYKEKAILVTGMQDTLKYCLRAKIDHNERLFVTKVIASEDLLEENLTEQIEEIRDSINCKIKKLKTEQRQMKQDLLNHVDKRF